VAQRPAPRLGRVESGRERPGEGIALVTVSHDSERELELLLQSVARHLPGAAMVVADSGSADASAERARAWAGGRARVIEIGSNVGFGRANNAALREVSEPVTVLVNPDVELLDASLAELAAELRRGPDRILSPQVLLPGGSRQDSAQHEPGAAPLLLSALVPPGVLPGPLARMVDPWRSDRPRRVGWAVGCCLAARTETLRRLGPFDERIFLYGEDLDLGLRAADEGVETWFWPAARVLHRRAHSTEREFGGEAFELLARRRREVVARRRGKRRARRDDLLQLLTFADRLALKTLLGRSAARERRQLAALRATRSESQRDLGAV
jgi:N-acetylglucosaminyl-diphospho-decaprenol L-rhamnosyltransferase